MRQPIYHIIGAWRSGTTLLSAMLDKHPNIIAPLESTFLMKAYDKFHNCKSWNIDKVDELVDLFFRNRDLKYVWKADPHKVRNEILSFIDEYPHATLGDLAKIVYLNYPSINPKNDVEVLVDKNPPYTLYYNELMDVYPETKFIVLVRDYRDNILSRMKYKFHSIQSTAVYAQWWKLLNKSVLELLNKYPQRTLLVKYEDLAREPEKYLQQICKFIDVAYYPDMLEFNKEFKIHTDRYIHDLQERVKDKSEAFRSERMEMGANLFNPVNTSQVNKWQNTMKNDDVKIAEYICGDIGAQFGYKRSIKGLAGFKLKMKKLLADIYVQFSHKIYIKRLKS